MNTPSPATPEKPAAAGGLVPRLKQQAAGLIADFWKDPVVEYPAFELKLLGRAIKIPNLLKPVASERPADAPAAAGAPRQIAVAADKPATSIQPWHALPGELAEKMWGEGHVLPAGDAILDMIVTPLKLAKDKNVLDLSAGLGGGTRMLYARAHQLKGLEVDPDIAARGMEMSVKAGKGKLVPIEHYDPTTFSMPAIYDVMIARELFYRVADKGKFFYSISAGIKTHGQTAFTDYIVDPENRSQPAIVAWQAHELGARPLGLIEMAEAWAKVGFEVRVSDDQTPLYRREVVAGINRFVAILRHAPPPDPDTKKAILREVEAWVHRLAAIQQGMKFYRFHALKT